MDPHRKLWNDNHQKLNRALTVQQKMKIAGKLRKKFAQKGLDADIIVKSESEIAPSKSRVGNCRPPRAVGRREPMMAKQ